MSSRKRPPKSFDKVMDHGGERVATETGGSREVATGKGRFDLLPMTSLFRLAKHYENGAQKYTRTVLWSLEEVASWLLSSAPAVERIEICTPEGYVASATRDGSTRTNQTMQSARGSVPPVGEKRTPPRKKSTAQSDKPAPQLGQEIEVPRGGLGSEPGDFPKSPWIRSTSSKEVGARSASEISKVSGQCILIMTMRQGECAESFAVGATTVSVSLETTWQELRRRSLISLAPRPTFSLQSEGKIRVVLSGVRNWEKGLPLSRFIDSAFRHLAQFMEGNREEDHLAAILWNISGYVWTEEQIRLGKLPATLNDTPWPDSLG